MVAYYNEIDGYCADWLLNLMEDDIIPRGVVDMRPIQEVRSKDLTGYSQCHFFAGIGGWALACRLAGLPDDAQIWTGSPPCQPFSSAGKKKGKQDERHLWPEFFRLIQQVKPPVVFGEQVEAAIAHLWWDDAADDLEREGYETGAAVLPACSVGAPHKRNRLWFVAYSSEHDDRGVNREFSGSHEQQTQKRQGNTCHSKLGGAGIVGYSDCDGQAASAINRSNGEAIQNCSEGQDSTVELAGTGGACNVADSSSQRQSRQGQMGESIHSKEIRERQADQLIDACTGLWDTNSYIQCPDGKQRLIEPSIPLLAYGVPARASKLRAYGNAIVPQLAAEFIKSATKGVKHVNQPDD